MSEDESKFSEAEQNEGVKERSEVAPLSTEDSEILSSHPLTFRNLPTGYSDHHLSFDFALYATGFHNAFIELKIGGVREFDKVYPMVNGLLWHPVSLALSRSGAAELKHKWELNQSGSTWYSEHFFVCELPVVDSASVFTNTITGSKGDMTSLQIIQEGSGYALSDSFVSTNSRWSTLLKNVHPGRYRIHVQQSVSGYPSRYSPVKEILYLTNPKVTTPTNNGVVKLDAAVSMTGTWGAPDQIIQLMNAGGGSELGRDFADSRGEWTISFNAKDRYPSGGLTELNVRHIDSGNAAWTKLNIFLLAPPNVTPPPSEVELSTTIGGTGHTGNGLSVDVFLDSSGGRIGGGPVTNGGWSAAVQFPTPGPIGVTAKQTYSSVQSEGAAPRVFYVRPSKPSLSVRSKGEGFELYGTGYNGARMDIHFPGNGTPYLDATVSAGSWSKDLPADLVPNAYKFIGRQSVSNGGTGRIFSTGWTDEVQVNVITPPPTGVTVTVDGQRATFSGRGRQWGTHEVKIGIYNNGVALTGVLQATVQTNLNWSTTATADLAPGVYTNLTARQGVNNQWSADSVKFSMTVASPPPEFINPPSNVPTGQLPQISGSAWPGSAIVLKIPEKPDVQLTATGGTFTLNATEEWAPGTYTLTATAAFGGGQPSSPGTRTFTVKTPVPTITTADNAEVDLVPVIKGRGFKGCWVAVYSSTHQELGDGPVDDEGGWTAELAERAPGNLIIYAVQKETRNSTNISDRTANLTVKVRVPKPGITVPEQNGRPARTSTFAGTTTASQGTVELSIKGENQPFIKDIPLKPDGSWAETVELSLGPKTVEARLRQKTYLSDPLERVITVVPNAPVIDTPRDGEAVGALLRISGFGYPGDEVRVDRRGNDTNLTSATVTPAGTWSAYVAHHNTEAVAISVLARAEGLDSLYSPTINLPVLVPAPQITEPLPGDWVGVRPLFSGLATPGASITVASWFNAEDVLAPVTVADDDGRWAVVGNKDLPVGAARVIMRQTVDGKASEWAESGRFMVERKTAQFDAPAVHFPLMGQKVGRWPMFKGTGVPGAEVIIYKKGFGNTVLGRARVDRDGAWAVQSLIELPVGDSYECSVHQIRDGATSEWLVPDRKFDVIQVPFRFEAPIMDTPVSDPSRELEQQPVFSGRGMPGAELKVSSSSPTWAVLATTRVDAQGNWRVRSEIVLPVGTYDIDAKQFMDGQHSGYSDGVYIKVAEKIDRPVIVSPVADAQISPREVIRGTAMPGVEVRLYRSGNGNVVWGKGVADELGQWVIVTHGLPLGSFRVAGKGYKGALQSPWMLEWDFTVIDAG